MRKFLPSTALIFAALAITVPLATAGQAQDKFAADNAALATKNAKSEAQMVQTGPNGVPDYAPNDNAAALTAEVAKLHAANCYAPGLDPDSGENELSKLSEKELSRCWALAQGMMLGNNDDPGTFNAAYEAESERRHPTHIYEILEGCYLGGGCSKWSDIPLSVSTLSECEEQPVPHDQMDKNGNVIAVALISCVEGEHPPRGIKFIK